MTFNEACKRAGGRRRYQAMRQRAQQQRQLVLLAVMVKYKWQNIYGKGYRLAEALSVDAATVSRDLRYLKDWRLSLIKDFQGTVGRTAGELCADTVAKKLLAANSHPKQGFSYTLDIQSSRRSPVKVRLQVKIARRS